MGEELLRSLEPPGVFELSSREFLARRGSESLSASVLWRERYQLPGPRANTNVHNEIDG
jgi:hypothetical protein